MQGPGGQSSRTDQPMHVDPIDCGCGKTFMANDLQSYTRHRVKCNGTPIRGQNQKQQKRQKQPPPPPPQPPSRKQSQRDSVECDGGQSNRCLYLTAKRLF